MRNGSVPRLEAVKADGSAEALERCARHRRQTGYATPPRAEAHWVRAAVHWEQDADFLQAAMPEENTAETEAARWASYPVPRQAVEPSAEPADRPVASCFAKADP